MKRMVFIFIAAICLCVCSCEKIKGSNGGGQETVIIDPAIVGTWEIVKYGALEQGKTEETKICDSKSEILETYHRFTFNSTGILNLWFGNPETNIDVDFYYDSSFHALLFGDTGAADVEKLDGTDFIFTCNSFMPISWYENDSIKEARVYCKKVQQ